jgi:two-component system nitrate/nitrite response regulator NarL
MTSVVLDGNHGMFLDAMAAVLTQRGYNVAVSRTITETVEAVRRRKLDVCLLDRDFAGTDSLAAIAELLHVSPATKVLILSADQSRDGVLRALGSGAAGYLHKSRGVAVVTEAIDRVRRGELVVDVPETKADQRPQQRDDARRLAGYLSPRERDCLGLMVGGLGTSAMAVKLGISQSTVRTHVQAVLTKLGVHSRLEATLLATRYQLVGEGAGPPNGRGRLPVDR